MVKLVIDVKEKPNNFFRLGLHVDSDFKTLVLFNATLRNFLIHGSKFSADIGVGDNPRYKLSYFVHTNWHPGISFGATADLNYLQLYDYEEGNRTRGLRYWDEKFSLQAQTDINSTFLTGVGINYQNTSLKKHIGIFDIELPEDHLLNYNFFMHFNSFNKPFFPSSGNQFIGDVNMRNNLKRFSDWKYKNYSFTVKSRNIIPLSRKISLHEYTYAGFSFGDSLFVPSYYMVGGLVNYDNIISFVGSYVGEIIDEKVVVQGIDLQVETWKNQYLTFKLNAGNCAEEMKGLLNLNNIIYGGGISYGINSIIGPLEATLTWASLSHRFRVYLRFGFRF